MKNRYKNKWSENIIDPHYDSQQFKDIISYLVRTNSSTKTKKTYKEFHKIRKNDIRTLKKEIDYKENVIRKEHRIKYFDVVIITCLILVVTTFVVFLKTILLIVFNYL